MVCCLNPRCQKPENPDGSKFCQNCGTRLIDKLRNRYRPVASIGQGGFGRTYLAIDEDRLQQKCAIKQFSPRLHETQAQEGEIGLEAKCLQLFEAEAKRLHELGEHPQIPTLYAYFAEGDRLYLVQQFIAGQTLSQIVREGGPFTADQVRSLLLDLLPVLQFVHEQQVVHRDLKPDNILRGPGGKLFLIDFGVAKQLVGEAQTRGGTRVGTEGYAPLEQLRSGHAYPSSDLYALGATCLFLLTGLPPEDLYDPMAGGWCWREAVAERGTTVDGALSTVLDKLLLDRVGDRYPSAAAALSDLTAERLPGQATIDPVAAQWSSARVLSGHGDRVQSLVFHPDGRWLASGSGDKTIRLWDPRAGQLLTSLAGHQGRVTALAVSPDGQTLISGGSDRRVLLWDTAALKPRLVLNHHVDWVGAIAVSADGQWAASVGDDGRANVWDLATGGLRHRLQAHRRKASSVALSPDGRWMATGGGSGMIRVWSLEEGKVVGTLSQHIGRVSGLVFSPDGRSLLSSSEDRTIKCWSITNGQVADKPHAILCDHADAVFALALSRDGRLLVSGSEDSTVKLWDLAAGRLLTTLSGHTWWVNAVALAPDSGTIASGSGDKTVHLWQALKP